MEQRLSDAPARRRIAVQLMSVFAALAGLLAVIGIYGVRSYLVDQCRGCRAGTPAHPNSPFE